MLILNDNFMNIFKLIKNDVFLRSRLSRQQDICDEFHFLENSSTNFYQKALEKVSTLTKGEKVIVINAWNTLYLKIEGF